MQRLQRGTGRCGELCVGDQVPYQSLEGHRGGVTPTAYETKDAKPLWVQLLTQGFGLGGNNWTWMWTRRAVPWEPTRGLCREQDWQAHGSRHAAQAWAEPPLCSNPPLPPRAVSKAWTRAQRGTASILSFFPCLMFESRTYPFGLNKPPLFLDDWLQKRDSGLHANVRLQLIKRKNKKRCLY